ncbi:hypothetical protein, partial [Bradyrhizobium yuanmingense]|uniref:hypothetical protein n=1 Tax=Bradyrhizobium yuanmingense TaxID=108015 RepID=UPI001ABF77FE
MISPSTFAGAKRLPKRYGEGRLVQRRFTRICPDTLVAKSVQGPMKNDLRNIYLAPHRAEAETAI